MKGIMQWFKSSNKMKRWIFLILIGIIFACYGIAEILVQNEITIQELIKIVVAFVIGFLCIVLGLIFLNKRTLEVLIESTDTRMNNKSNINLKSLVFDKTVYHQGPKIVVIGGGTGLNTVLTGLKKYTDNLTAIVTVSDYGEENSKSQQILGTSTLGDIKDSIVALSEEGEELEKLMNYKFTDGILEDLSFADIYFSAMKNIDKDFSNSIVNSNKIFNIIGQVIPVTLDEMNINAELENGYVIKEKSRIPELVYEKVTKINRIYLNPSNCRMAPGVLKAIKEADCVIIGPGSLYTNVIPNLLVNGVAKAIKETTAFKVYISNIMTEPGQTDNYGVADHIKAIIDHCGKGLIDYCIYDTGEIVPEFIKKYNSEGQELVEQDIEKQKGITYLKRNLSAITNGCIRHDPTLVAQSIIELICDDLKYQDKQNDPEYLMLNNKLREDKRINKIKQRMKREKLKENKKPKKKQIKGNSKFKNKYSDRIESIRKADKKIKERELKKHRNKTKKVASNKESKEVLEFRREYEETIKHPKRTSGTKKSTGNRKKSDIKNRKKVKQD